MTSSAQPTSVVAIACGGTGGHLFPGLAVGEELRRCGCRVSLLISPKEVDQQAVKFARGMEIITLPAVALQRGQRLAFLRGCWQSWRAARKLFRSRPPGAVLAMGGFTSAPPVLAARSLGVKTFLHESNAIPGRANRWLARFVDHAFVGFPLAAPRLRTREVTVTGTPVREAFKAREAAACRAALGLDPARPVVLVTGGSQGATGLNEMILSALPQFALRAPAWQWLHLAGPQDTEKVRSAYAQHRLKAVVHPFLAEMECALGAATVAVSRAGASSLAELAAVRVPSVLVPFPQAADDHQRQNARAFADSGAAYLLEQTSVSPDKIVSLVAELVEQASAREKMQLSLAQWHAPKAAEMIAQFILTALGERVANGSRRSKPAAGMNDLNLKVAG